MVVNFKNPYEDSQFRKKFNMHVKGKKLKSIKK